MDDQSSRHAPAPTNEDQVVRLLRTVWGLGVPPEASALHARWWQLETWLRELLYVELKAKEGVAWGERLPSTPKRRTEAEARYADYMPTADSHHVLAYLDVGPLFNLIETEWEILAHALLPRNIWLGRAEELQTIRNRIAHCRRPHPDDLARVEQTLRDLETGAFKSIVAFNSQREPLPDFDDPVVGSWVRRDHVGAQRLIDHCESQYDVQFRLTYSARPWVQSACNSVVSGTAGYFWHANWTIGKGYFRVLPFWSDLTQDVKDLLLFVAAPTPAEVSVSFPALDDPTRIADAIERVFDTIIYSIARRARSSEREIWDHWEKQNQGLDPRVLINSPWSVIGYDTIPVTLFGA